MSEQADRATAGEREHDCPSCPDCTAAYDRTLGCLDGDCCTSVKTSTEASESDGWDCKGTRCLGGDEACAACPATPPADDATTS